MFSAYGVSDWTYSDLAHGLLIIINWNGAGYDFTLQQSGFQDWTIVNGPLTWVPASSRYEANWVRTKVTGAAATQTGRVRWSPIIRTGLQEVHADCAEWDPATNSAWRWTVDAVHPLGFPYWTMHRGGNLWLTDSVRGQVQGFAGWPTLPDFSGSYVWYGVDRPPGF
jgi:hypothetical protein